MRSTILFVSRGFNFTLSSLLSGFYHQEAGLPRVGRHLRGAETTTVSGRQFQVLNHPESGPGDVMSRGLLILRMSVRKGFLAYGSYRGR